MSSSVSGALLMDFEDEQDRKSPGRPARQVSTARSSIGPAGVTLAVHRRRGS